MKPLMLVLALVVAVPSKGPAPAPAKEGQVHQNQATEEHREPYADQQATGSAPPALPQPGAVATTRNQTDAGNVDKGHSPNDGWEITGTIAGVINTGLLTFFSGVLAWLAYRQWRAMDRQAKVMHRQAVVMRRQLASMKTTGDDTHELAMAAQSQVDLLNRYVEAAVTSANMTRKQLEAYERPWLTASIIQRQLDSPTRGQFEFSGDGKAAVWFSLKVENIGKSLATDVTVATRLVAYRDPFTLFSQPRDLTTAQDHSVKFTLFPGEVNDRLGARREAPSSEIEEVAWRLTVSDTLFLSMAVIGRVVYRFANSDDPHHTDFAFLIGKKAPTSMVSPFLTVGDSLSSDEIEWMKLPGDDAN